MSDSEDYGSAKDDNFKASDASAPESSEDEPLVKNKKSVKTPKSKSKKKDKKKSKGRPSKAETKSKGRGRPSKAPKPADTDNDKAEEEYEVEAIVGHREYNGKLVYKIRWKNYESIHDTWEDYGSLSCPDLLEMYNIKNSVHVPKSIAMKRKSGSSGSAKKPKKRRTSESDEVSEVEEQDPLAEEYEVNKILQVKVKKDGTREFLVHWKRWSSDYDTWEPEANLSCPDIIEKFMQRVEKDKETDAKELRVNPRHTKVFTLHTREDGRRLSKRGDNKQRVQYYDADGDDE